MWCPRNRVNSRISFRLYASAVVVGLVGARLWTTAESIARDPSLGLHDAGGLALRGGLTWYGGLVLGCAAVVVGARMAGLSVESAFDGMAPGLAVGQGIGRIGCFLVGDDYGRPTASLVGIAFPEGSPPTAVPVHPTQLYEMAWLLMLGWWLWRRRDRSPSPFGEYLVLAGIGRWTIEWVRTNPEFLGPFTNAQVVAMTAMIVGTSLWLRSRSAPERVASAAGS